MSKTKLIDAIILPLFVNNWTKGGEASEVKEKLAEAAEKEKMPPHHVSSQEEQKASMVESNDPIYIYPNCQLISLTAVPTLASFSSPIQAENPHSCGAPDLRSCTKHTRIVHDRDQGVTMGISQHNTRHKNHTSFILQARGHDNPNT